MRRQNLEHLSWKACQRLVSSLCYHRSDGLPQRMFDLLVICSGGSRSPRTRRTTGTVSSTPPCATSLPQRWPCAVVGAPPGSGAPVYGNRAAGGEGSCHPKGRRTARKKGGERSSRRSGDGCSAMRCQQQKVFGLERQEEQKSHELQDQEAKGLCLKEAKL